MDAEKKETPQELIDYLHTMITPPEGNVPVVENLADVDWSQYEDQELHGLIIKGQAATEWQDNSRVDEVWRVLKPGAHIMLIAPGEEPTGHSGACALEDKGFEIRDAILLVQEPGRLHYVPKASTAERNKGVVPYKQETRMIFAKEGADIDTEIFSAKEIGLLKGAGLPAEDFPESVFEDDEFEKNFVEELQVRTTQNSHPTVKPKEIMSRLMESLPQDALVLDPFMGSGATGIACIESGRNFIGIENEEEYIRISTDRMEYWASAEQRPWDVKVESEAPKREEAEDPFEDLFG